MEFKIHKKHNPSKYKDCFVFKIETMIGDADGYDSIVLEGFKKDCEESKKMMVDLVNTLNGMLKAYPNGRCGGDDYDHVDGFNRWFAEDLLDELEEWYESLSNFEKSIYDQAQWPYNPYGDSQQSIESYKIFYYDEFGNEYDVSVV